MPMIMTYETAMACAMDAANAQMRKAGRKAWNLDDRNLAAETFARLYPIQEHLAQLDAASFQPPAETVPSNRPRRVRADLPPVWPEWDAFDSRKPWTLRIVDGSGDFVRHPPDWSSPGTINPPVYVRRFKTGLDAYRWAEKHGYRLERRPSPTVARLLAALQSRLRDAA